MRTCRKCGHALPGEQFYCYANGKEMAQCKSCIKSRVRKHRNDNIERIREYDRQRANQPHRVAKRAEIFEAFKQSQPERRAAHIAVGNAVRCGSLKKEPCAFCGHTGRVEAHHQAARCDLALHPVPSSVSRFGAHGDLSR